MNVILDNSYRIKYQNIIKSMTNLIPESMSRKIDRANVQQAWMVDNFIKVADKKKLHLCVGCYEDTAYEYLCKIGYEIIGIDPVINESLETFVQKYPHSQFHTVFSTSVIEHVEDDEKFIADMCQLITPGGYGLLTCDYNPNYPNVPKPFVDVRLYNNNDLENRIFTLLQQKEFAIYGEVDYNGNIDFEYEQCRYAFATMMFQRKE
jgi:SAM-dependent methyltransferase